MATLISTEHLTYTASSKTFTGQASTFALTSSNYPDTLTVQSHTKGGQRVFSLTSEEMENLEPIAAIYTSGEFTLRLCFSSPTETVVSYRISPEAILAASSVPATPIQTPEPIPAPIPAPVAPAAPQTPSQPTQNYIVRYRRMPSGAFGIYRPDGVSLFQGDEVYATSDNGSVRLVRVGGQYPRSRPRTWGYEWADESPRTSNGTNGNHTPTTPVTPATPPVAPVVSNVSFSQEDVSKLGEMVLVDYDVVTGASYEDENGRTIRVYNPAWMFHGFAGRTTKSVWVCRKSRTPWHWIAEARKASAIVDGVRKFCDVNVISIGVPGPEMLSLVLQNLQRDIANAESSMQKSLDTYAANYERDSNDPTINPTTALETYQRNCRATTRTCQKRIETLRKFASEFNLTGYVGTDVGRIRNVANSLQKLTDVRTSSYVNIAERMRGTALEAAAQADDVPATVMLDVLEENGEDVSSERTIFDS